MHVIIMGGTGLIGRALAASLTADNHQVTVLSRDPSHAPHLPPGVRLERWDGRTAAGWGALVDGADAVVNLAGASLNRLWTARNKRRILESRLSAGRAVADAIAMARIRPRVLIQASAVGYYGARGDALLDETALAGSGFLAEVCVAWEAATRAVEALGVRRVVIRTAVVLANTSVPLRLLALPFRFFVGGTLGSGDAWLAWIHLFDEVAAIRFLIEQQNAIGPFNLAAPEPVTHRDLARRLGQVLGRPSWLPVPAWAMRAALGEMATVLLDSQRVLPQRLQDLGFVFRYPTALEALGVALASGGAG